MNYSDILDFWFHSDTQAYWFAKNDDFDELIRIVDRIIFFQDGMLMKDVPNENLSHEDVIRIRDEVKEKANQINAAS